MIIMCNINDNNISNILILIILTNIMIMCK